jgi:hypothetical protein
MPTLVQNVEVPANTVMQASIANKLPQWGNGGGLQFDFKGARAGIFSNRKDGDLN